MTRHKMGAIPTGRQGPKQAAKLARLAAIGALGMGLAGCSAVPNLVHRAEGGQIAKPRQPPPGLTQPYPNLATVPARPPAPDQKALEAISQSLIADRNNASHLVLPPPPDPSSPAASPSLFGVGTVPPPPPPGSPSATLAAAEAAPAQATSASAPASTPAPTAPAPAHPAAVPAPTPSRSVASTPLGPDVNPTGPANVQVPPGPPAPPRLASIAPPLGAPPGATPPVPAAATPPARPAPAASPPPPRIAAAPALPANPATTVDVPFPPTSAVLPAASASALRTLAQRRGNRVIAVVGHGDAESTDPAVQSQAVSLGLQRAQAIAQALAADGVPEAAVRLDASANGRGGSARLVE